MSYIPDKDIKFSVRIIPLSDMDSVLELNQNHFHSDYELYFLEEGNADFSLGGSIYHLQPNDLVIVPPNVYHCSNLKNTNLYKRTVIQFAPTHFVPKPFFELNTLLPYYRISTKSTLYHLINHLKNVANYTNESERLTCISQVTYLILAELNRLKSNDTASEIPITQHPLSNVVQYIDNNLHIPLTIDSIARALFLSPSFLSHNFQKYMHISLKQYINHKKILTAQQLIESGVPIMQAAERCGFENYSTFYFQYKKILGTAPRPMKEKQ